MSPLGLPLLRTVFRASIPPRPTPIPRRSLVAEREEKEKKRRRSETDGGKRRRREKSQGEGQATGSAAATATGKTTTRAPNTPAAPSPSAPTKQPASPLRIRPTRGGPHSADTGPRSRARSPSPRCCCRSGAFLPAHADDATAPRPLLTADMVPSPPPPPPPLSRPAPAVGDQ